MNVDASRIKTVIIRCQISDSLAAATERDGDDIESLISKARAQEVVENYIIGEAAREIASKLLEHKKFLISKCGTRWQCRIDVIVPDRVSEVPP